MFPRMVCEVPTDVMEPTIKKGATIVADLSYYANNRPQRWDVVLFWAPELEEMGPSLGRSRIDARKCGAIANAACDIFEHGMDVVLPGTTLRPHIFYVKRVVGLPGERLRFRSDSILLDGRPILVPPDLRGCYTRFERTDDYRFAAKEEYEIPEHHLFVLSDNLRSGKDSREIGGVTMDNLFARVVA